MRNVATHSYPTWEVQYKILLAKLRNEGTEREQRAVLQSTGQRPKAISIFAPEDIRITDVENFHPVMTLRKMSWKAVVGELLWFLSGSSNVGYLRQNGITIWDKWADANGKIAEGNSYGRMWREYPGETPGFYYAYDQINALITSILEIRNGKENHPARRRLILLSYNPGMHMQASSPTGCHSMCQFYLNGDVLDAKLTMRSIDTIMGLPYNIACYALLMRLFAARCGMTAGTLTISLGDAHIYSNHLDMVDEMLTRPCLCPPTLEFSKEKVISSRFEQILDSGLRIEDFVLMNYESHNAIKGEVAV